MMPSSNENANRYANISKYITPPSYLLCNFMPVGLGKLRVPVPSWPVPDGMPEPDGKL